MAEEKIRIVIDGNAKGVVNAADQAHSSISRLGKIIGGLAIGGGVLMLAKKGFDMLSGAIKGTIGFIQGCIDAAAEEQLQLKKLEQALISTSNFTKVGYKELQNYATELQKVTRYGDENIIAVEAMLATFKLNTEEIKIATQATLDLAAATGQDLQSASILMGKAMVGEVGMLKRYGIIVDEAKYKAEGWKAVIDEINVEFGGQAVAQATTYAGSIDRLKNVFGDMKEEIGKAFIPTIQKLIDWFMKGKEVIDPLTGSVENMASPFEKLKTWVHEATEAFGKYLELNWDNIVGFAESVFKRISGFITIVKEADYSEITKGIDDLKEAFGMLIGDVDSGIVGAENKYQGFIDRIGESMQIIATFVAGVKAFGDTIYFIFGSITNAIAILIEFLGALGLWFVSMGSDGQEEFKNLGFMIEGFKNGFIEDSAKMQEAWQKYSDFINRSSGDMKGSIDKYSDSLKNIPKEITTTIKTDYVSSYAYGASQGRAMTQSGGLQSRDVFSSDLNIPLFKGEAVIPADLVRAIKENRGSFAGVSANRSSSVENNFYISSLVVREEADVEKIAQDLFSMQKVSLAGVGIR